MHFKHITKEDIAKTVSNINSGTSLFPTKDVVFALEKLEQEKDKQLLLPMVVS